LLAELADPSFSGQLRRVFEAAAQAIFKLGELELVKYEDAPIDASADLSLWEELAPVLGSTIADVNALLAEISINFPAGELYVDPKRAELDTAIQKCAAQLRADVNAFGMGVRDPSVVGDRWNLISKLQSFRYQCRDLIGTTVYEAAQTLGDVRRQDVEPGYAAALATALLVRTTMTDLRRLIRSRFEAASQATADEMQTHALMVGKGLNAFGKTPAWTALGAEDKKQVLEFRKKLNDVVAESQEGVLLIGILEPFVEFVDTAANVERQMLVQNDREVAASLGVVLERATNAAGDDEALLAYQEALTTAQALYGRTPEFDAFLRRARKAEHTAQTVRADTEQFLITLANANVY
jgi:hypothetical protein